MAEFYRKLILTPDVLFDTLEDYPAEVFVEVFRAVRNYVHYWDIHRTDNGFDVSGLSPDARAVFRSVVKQMRMANADYFGRTISELNAENEIQQQEENSTALDDIKTPENEHINAHAAALAKRKAKINHRRKKDKKRVQKHREKMKNLKALQKQCSRLSGQEIAEISAEGNKKSVTKSASNPCPVKDSGDFCAEFEKSVTKTTSKPYPESDSGDFCSRVYNNNYYLNTYSKELLDSGKGGMGEKQVFHKSSSVDKSNNQTSGLSCSKAVPIAAVPAIGGSKEERRDGSREDGSAAVGQLDNNPAIAGSNAVGGLRPESARKANAAAPAAKNFNLLSAPHKPNETEILITDDFKIDLDDEFFSAYHRADKFLIRGVEKYLINNLCGRSVEKRWICKQIYKFAERQGKISLLLGLTPEEYKKTRQGGENAENQNC
ncbi:MAG: hypothetical protein IJ660_00895 [Alphaproteobacteria bacterium]|nr:hypothetical protein [Alphaproteobacteria bacterium]